jgi:hypothetical protein
LGPFGISILCVPWPFGLFCGHLVIFSPFWCVVPAKKNLATPVLRWGKNINFLMKSSEAGDVTNKLAKQEKNSRSEYGKKIYEQAQRSDPRFGTPAWHRGHRSCL